MINKEIDYRKLYKNSTKKVIYIFLLILLLVLSKHILMQYLLSQQETNSQVINIAGKQRMLSQKISKDTLLILKVEDKKQFEYYKDDLIKSLKTFEDSHNILKTRKNDPVVTHIFKDIEYYFNNILKSGNEIIKLLDGNYENINFQLVNEKIEIIRKSEGLYLTRMDDIVQEYDEKTTKAIGSIKLTDNIMMSLIITMFFLLLTRLIRPIQRAIKIAFLDVNENNENIIKMFNTMGNPLFLIREDGEIVLINSKGKKIIGENFKEDEINNIKDVVKWLTFDISKIIDKIILEESVEDIEGRIKNSLGEEIFFTLSGVSGSYKGKGALFITINDYTIQKKAEEQMKDIAIRDELTGLYNRRYLNMIIGDEIERAERYEIPLSIFILDLDFFKKINDLWGHPVGDSVLKMTGEIISKSTRLSDFQFRIGGEEFLIIMPHTDFKGAKIAAEKLRIEIEKVIHPVAGKFTASLGVAERKKGETYHQLYQNADAALYKAKETGRNRVEGSENEVDEAVSLDWKDAWTCGEEIIDKQHKELFIMSSKLLEAYATSPGKAEVLKYLDDIIESVKEHFNYEEEVLAKINYPDLYKHRHIHSDIVEKAMEIRENINNGVVDISKAFMFLFVEVITGHMLKEDIKFFSLINKL